VNFHLVGHPFMQMDLSESQEGLFELRKNRKSPSRHFCMHDFLCQSPIHHSSSQQCRARLIHAFNATCIAYSNAGFMLAELETLEGPSALTRAQILEVSCESKKGIQEVRQTRTSLANHIVFAHFSDPVDNEDCKYPLVQVCHVPCQALLTDGW